jgi:hypothetical protein
MLKLKQDGKLLLLHFFVRALSEKRSPWVYGSCQWRITHFFVSLAFVAQVHRCVGSSAFFWSLTAKER